MRETELEDESSEAKSRRRRTLLLHWASATLIALIYIFSYDIAEKTGGLVAAAFPIAVLSVWWLFYARLMAQMDERDRAIEFRAIAVSGAVMLWALITLNTLHEIAGTPMLPLALFLPLTVVAYGAARFIWQRFFL